MKLSELKYIAKLAAKATIEGMGATRKERIEELVEFTNNGKLDARDIVNDEPETEAEEAAAKALWELFRPLFEAELVRECRPYVAAVKKHWTALPD